MTLYRLSKEKYAQELSGKGAAKSGNRWNSKGTEIIYTAESRALAMAEVAVHISLAYLPSDYMMIEIDVPKSVSVAVLNVEELDNKWKAHPPRSSSQLIGDKFVYDMESCILKVPSAVVQGDFNYLINPYHKDFKKIKISKITHFPFDKRIFR